METRWEEDFLFVFVFEFQYLRISSNISNDQPHPLQLIDERRENQNELN